MEDGVLDTLIEVATLDIIDGRRPFENPLDEPLFYRRHFRKWVSAALAEKETETGVYDDIMTKAMKREIKLPGQ